MSQNRPKSPEISSNRPNYRETALSFSETAQSFSGTTIRNFEIAQKSEKTFRNFPSLPRFDLQLTPPRAGTSWWQFYVATG